MQYFAIIMGCLLVTSHAWAHSSLIVDKKVYTDGREEVEIASRSDDTVEIYSAVINRSIKPECKLAPIESDFGQSLVRSDVFTNPTLAQIGGQWAIDAIKLSFGGTVTALSPRSCGRILEISIETKDGDYVVSWSR